MKLKSKSGLLLSSAIVGALAPLLIWGLSHFVPDLYKDYCGQEVAASYCAENVLAERTAERFELITLPFWPTRPIVAIASFMMMEEGRDADLLAQLGVTSLAMFLNAASYVLVVSLLIGLKDLRKQPHEPLV